MDSDILLLNHARERFPVQRLRHQLKKHREPLALGHRDRDWWAAPRQPTAAVNIDITSNTPLVLATVKRQHTVPGHAIRCAFWPGVAASMPPSCLCYQLMLLSLRWPSRFGNRCILKLREAVGPSC
jgi:hypothetical protein